MQKPSGFSILEAMVVVAIVAILGMMAIPSYMHRITREQIEKSMPLAAEVAQPAITALWKADKKFPANNEAAGIPIADKIVGNFVKSVRIEDGAIHIEFGNHANAKIKNRVLSLRPAVIEDAPMVPITWVCGNAEAPQKMTVHGVNRTSIEPLYLPVLCRTQIAK